MSLEWLGLTDTELIDHHCHGVVRDDLDRPAFEMFITESFWPAPGGTSHFDSPMGLAVRRWCSPLLDLEPMAPAERYMARRLELGAADVNRRLMEATGITELLVDTGFTSSMLLSPDEMGATTGAHVAEICRIEAVAERLATTGIGATEFLANYPDALRRESRDSVGFKTIIAYRHGLDFEPERPGDEEALTSIDRWFSSGDRSRVTEPIILRWLLWTAIDVASEGSLPIQFHVGYGDGDLELHRCNPLLMTRFIRATLDRDVPITLLHCYPYEREAGYLAAVFPNVYFDVGSIVHYTGAESHRVISHSLELSSFHKILFSTDAYALPELYVVGTALFRRGLRQALSSWIATGDCTEPDADRIEAMILAGNARRIYGTLNVEG